MTPVRRAHPRRVIGPYLPGGFTLLEVLISLFILSVGMLGMAALQARAISFNTQAYNHGQAIALAYDIADRIRANPTESASGFYGVAANLSSATDQGCNSPTANCSTTELAIQDLYEWSQSLANSLPNGGGSICLDSNPADAVSCDGAGDTYTITVTWDEPNESGVTSRSYALRLKQ